MQNEHKHVPFFPPIVKPLAKLRFANLTPYAPDVHICLDGHNTEKNLKYRNFTGFSNVIAGEHQFSAYLPDKPQMPIFNEKLFLPAVNCMTYCLIGNPRQFRLLSVNNSQKPPRTQCFIKFVHAASNMPPLDIVMVNEKEIGNGLKYPRESRNYIIPGGRHEIGFRLYNRTVLTTGPHSFVNGKSYTVFVIGQPNAHPPLQAIVTES